MVKFKSIFQSDLIAAIEITAEYKAAYSETDFIAFPAISFPLISAFEYSAGKTKFQLNTNYVLFEKANTEFQVSKYDIFNTDVTLCIQFQQPPDEFSSFFSTNAKQVSVKKRQIITEMLLRKFEQPSRNRNEFLSEQLLFNILNSVLAGSHGVIDPVKTNQHTIRQIDLAKEYIHAYYHNNLSITQIASAAFLSPFHFSRLFRQCTGHSPYEYLTRLRIEHAKSMLTQGRSVIETAFNTGFNSIENFSFAFSRRVGCPPSSFKNSRIS
jgi:AraC-like DNA-binding protein